MPALAPRIQSDVWKTIKNYHQHTATEWESQYRKEMGIPDDQPLPAMGGGEYPKMVYSQEYFSTDDPSEQAFHVQTVHSKEQQDSLASDGWYGTLAEAKKAFYASKDQKKK
jgi:hypothetical protein